MSLIVSFFMGFHVNSSDDNQNKSCLSIYCKFGILRILDIFELSNIYV